LDRAQCQLLFADKPLLPEGIAQPDDIADAVAWLASDESKFVTASEVSVDLGVAHC
jgi:NAD(P)-dependent dehydrogenase (short-subunit alcohol dehydrogenase family)